MWLTGQHMEKKERINHETEIRNCYGKTGDEYIVVATGEAAKSFNGIIRNNKTANFVFEQLKEDKSSLSYLSN